MNLKRKFLFREIRFGFKKIFIINIRIAYFQFNDDSSIDIKSKGRTITIREQEEKNVLLIKAGVIILQKAKKVEILLILKKL